MLQKRPICTREHISALAGGGDTAKGRDRAIRHGCWAQIKASGEHGKKAARSAVKAISTGRRWRCSGGSCALITTGVQIPNLFCLCMVIKSQTPHIPFPQKDLIFYFISLWITTTTLQPVSFQRLSVWLRLSLSFCTLTPSLPSIDYWLALNHSTSERQELVPVSEVIEWKGLQHSFSHSVSFWIERGSRGQRAPRIPSVKKLPGPRTCVPIMPFCDCTDRNTAVLNISTRFSIINS